MNRSPHFSTWITLCLVVAALAVQSAAVELPHKIVLNAPFTPFKNDSSQAVNLEPIAALAKHAKEVGVNVVWACGGMGQFDTLTMDERKAIALEWVVEGHKNGLYIIVHVGTTVLAEAIELAQHAASIGADAIASVPPYYEHGSFDEVVDFLNRISQQGAPKLPFFYYHIPGSTHQDMNIYDLLTAAPTKLPMLAGVKYVSSDLVDFMNCQNDYGDKYAMMFAPEPKITGIALGARSAILAEDFYAQTWIRMLDAFEKGNMAEARRQQLWKYSVMDIFSKYGGGAAERTIYRHLLGVDLGPPRHPQTAISEQQYQQMVQELEGVKFFDQA